MNVATQRRSDLSTIAPDRSAARMPGTGPLRRSSGPVRNQAIVGKSRIEATLHRCERSVFLLHTNHFPVAGTLNSTQTFCHPQTQQYEPPPNTAKSSLNLNPKKDIHAEPLQEDAEREVARLEQQLHNHYSKCRSTFRIGSPFEQILREAVDRSE